jgi:hypothetical protein
MVLLIKPFGQGELTRVKIQRQRSDHNSKSLTGSMSGFSQHFNYFHGSRRGFLLTLEY